jgi:hypothetical protein
MGRRLRFVCRPEPADASFSSIIVQACRGENELGLEFERPCYLTQEGEARDAKTWR